MDARGERAATQHDFDRLVTEDAASRSFDLDASGTRELVRLMNEEDLRVPAVVGAAADEIASAIDAIVQRLAGGGRLIYVGAGTSGGLAALDASECEATFSTEPGRVVAVVAGEQLDSVAARAAAEDDAPAGADAVAALGVGAQDAVVGVSASGRTPYVLGALEAAAEAGAVTACIVCAPDSELARLTEHELAVVVGPEILAGSTRLKAGTAQKLVLNMISTISMIRLGKTFGNLMVDVLPGNDKLRARTARIVETATGATPERAAEALAAADGDARVAIVSLLAGVDAGAARERLGQAKGDIRRAAGR